VTPPADIRSGTAGLAAALAAGSVIAIPTDTVYGLVCDPGNLRAVRRVYDVKGRPDALELTLLAASAADLEGLVEFNEPARRVAAAYWPGGVSIILPVGTRRLAIPLRGGTLSCRVPGHALALKLLRQTGPLASTSANRHGMPAAITAGDAVERLRGQVDTILDGGPAAGRASTIIDCTTTPPRVLREGPVTSAALLALLRTWE